MISDNLLLAKIKDATNTAARRNSVKFVGFLNLHEISVVKQEAEAQNLNYKFWGGFENAERVIFAALPNHIDSENDDVTFPISAVTFKYKPEYKLTHRDFLGTFMSLGITREKIGDIVVNDGCTVTFFHNDVLNYIESQLEKVGGVGVCVNIGITEPIVNNDKYEELRYTIASNRLDCIVSALLNCSREKSLLFINSKKVFVNDVECLNPSKKINNESQISIRSTGKFIIDSVDKMTKKGRFILLTRKKV